MDVTFSLGVMPNFYDEKHMEELNEDQDLDGCVVKLELDYDENLDVSAIPLYLCWTNLTWAEEKNITISVENNDEIDAQDPRKRYIEVNELLSVDAIYNNINKINLRIQVLVYDDEYCDPDFCVRGRIDPEINDLEYDDEIQEIKTVQIELVVILIIFFGAILVLIGLWIKKKRENVLSSDEYQKLYEEEKGKERLNEELKEMDEIEKFQQFEKKQKERKIKKQKEKPHTNERQSLLRDTDSQSLSKGLTDE